MVAVHVVPWLKFSSILLAVGGVRKTSTNQAPAISKGVFIFNALCKIAGLFTGHSRHDLWVRSGDIETNSRVESGLVRGYSKSHGSGRARSGREVFEIARIGSGGNQFSRVGLGYVDPARPARTDPVGEKPCKIETNIRP